MRCEGWTKHGSAWSLGPITWTQCRNEAISMLLLEQEGKETEQPACKDCIEKCEKLDYIKIKKVIPFVERM